MSCLKIFSYDLTFLTKNFYGYGHSLNWYFGLGQLINTKSFTKETVVLLLSIRRAIDYH